MNAGTTKWAAIAALKIGVGLMSGTVLSGLFAGPAGAHDAALPGAGHTIVRPVIPVSPGPLPRRITGSVPVPFWADMCAPYPFGDSGQEAPPRELPKGPFTTAEGHGCCALLIYVPEEKDPIGHTIDLATGGYGYSHVAIDCCEIDQRTGKAVMFDTVGDYGVHRAFQDTYGKRPFVRVPLAAFGIDCKELCKCVESKLGQPFDFLESYTKGAVDDPGKQICSGLANICLPAHIRRDIARKIQNGELREGSGVVYGGEGANGPSMFVSANALAQYFGVPARPGLIQAYLDAIRNALRGRGFCYHIRIRVSNLKVAKITQTPIAPSPRNGCWSLTDKMIVAEVSKKVEAKVNKDSVKGCPEGYGCLSTRTIRGPTLHFKTHHAEDVHDDRGLPDIHCRVTCDIEFDITVEGEVGICWKK